MKKYSFLLIALFYLSACGNTPSQSQENVIENQPPEETRPKVMISTSHGDMIIELYNETPQHRDNFLKLAEEGFYNGTLFHRVIDGFMIQGGDPDSKNAEPGTPLGMGGPGYTVPAEFVPSLIHRKGALSAARMGDQVNPEKASSGSQFYIVQGKAYTPEELDMIEQRIGQPMTNEQRVTYSSEGGTPHLDGGYTVFGQVVEGLDVIDKIAAVEKDPADRPLQDIEMTVKILE